MMEELIIKGTEMSPEIIFTQPDILSISGRAIPDNASQMFEPLIKWIEKFKGTTITFDINMEYLNTSSSMLLFAILRSMDENEDITNISVIWHYEEDDEDHYDTGLAYEEKLTRTKFSYKMEFESAA